MVCTETLAHCSTSLDIMYVLRLLNDNNDMFLYFRGVGCIFTEMISGLATFPGMKDDQLDMIFRVSVSGLHFLSDAFLSP